MPRETAKLHGLLNDYLADVGAKLPVANPQYDPTKAPAVSQRGGGEKKPGGEPRPGPRRKKPRIQK